MPRSPCASGLLVLTCAVMWEDSATASPWTLPRGTVALSAAFDFQFADSEFLESGAYATYPLRGQFTGASIALDARYGLSDRLEIELALPVRLVSYASDPVIVRAQPAGSTQSLLDFYQANVLDFSQASAGVGDVQIATTLQLLLEPLALAAELRLQLPSGYRAPEGTFGAEPKTVAEFVADPELARPENIRDDLTLGDGQVDVSLQLLVGKAFASNTFVRAGAGYRLRLGGAGDQIQAELRAGQGIAEVLLLYAGADLRYSVQTGDVVGISVVSVDPALPASAYDGGANLQPVARHLAFDAVTVSGGLIARLSREVELNVGYQRTVWGRNVAAVHGLDVSITYHRSLQDADD